MNKITTVGIDLAKHTFQVATLNSHHKLIANKAYSRTKLTTLMLQHSPCVVGMEACGSAHYWASIFASMGHTVKLLPPAYVKGFVYGNKNDSNDAKAIALATLQPESPTVCPKTFEQLALQALMRVRERRISQRTDCVNQIRGLLAEHGIIIAKGMRAIRQIDVAHVPCVMQSLVNTLLSEFNVLDQYANDSNQTVQRTVKTHPTGQRLLAIPGFGPINTLASLVINPSDYRNGRHYAAYLGLVPKQTGTGGQVRLQGLSKRGNQYHRQTMCHGARAYLCCSKQHGDPLLMWAKRIQAKKGTNVAVGALANKLSRISWKVMNGDTYCVSKAVSPMTN